MCIILGQQIPIYSKKVWEQIPKNNILSNTMYFVHLIFFLILEYFKIYRKKIAKMVEFPNIPHPVPSIDFSPE